MAYTNKSIQKVIGLMKDFIRKYEKENIEDVRMCISDGNKKIGRVMNVSLPPVMSCGNCKGCKHFCYDIKACLQYPHTVIDARIRNWIILKRDRDEFFRRIERAISRRRANFYFRWHVSGDIIDANYLERMIEIAKAHPEFVFWTYTKMYDLVNEYVRTHGGSREAAIPSNLHIMFSEWDGMEMPNPYNFPIFTVQLKDGNKNHEEEFFATLYHCPGNCDVCKANGRGCLAGEDTVAKEH